MPDTRKYKSIGNGVYKGVHGYYIRPWISRKRTWRKLEATSQRTAIREARSILSQTLNKAPQIGDLIRSYFKADCPNVRLEPAPNQDYIKHKARYKAKLLEWLEFRRADEINIPLLHQYAAWRRPQIKGSLSGASTIDQEITLLSTILTYAAAIGLIPSNPIQTGRPRFASGQKKQKSRERMPKDANQIHDLARAMFEGKFLTAGFFVLFAAFTGCRKSELLRMRLDARPGEPGAIEGDILHVQRSKRGVNPFILIHEPLAELIRIHRQVMPGPWYFPGKDSRKAVEPCYLAAIMRDHSKILGIDPTLTPHGLRAYYVTKRRSDGIMDAQIAAEIGDKTVSLISQTYGEAPPNWQGREKLEWMPDGEPAWSVVQPGSPLVVQ